MKIKFFIITLFLFVFAIACRKQNDHSPVKKADINTITNIKQLFDLGIVTNDIVYDCNIGSAGQRIVKAFATSCGCTTADIKEGQLLDLNRSFKIIVLLANKPPGKGSQSLAIDFQEGSRATVELTYFYQPVPFATPRYVLFEKSETNFNVSLSFPGEEKVEINKLNCPQFINYSILPQVPPNASQILIQFVCNGRGAEDTHQGMIYVETTSKKRPKFNIPFLILENE